MDSIESFIEDDPNCPQVIEMTDFSELKKLKKEIWKNDMINGKSFESSFLDSGLDRGLTPLEFNSSFGYSFFDSRFYLTGFIVCPVD